MKIIKRLLSVTLMLAILIAAVPVIETNALSTPSIKIVSKTSSTVTFDVVYPNQNAWGNRLEICNLNNQSWKEIQPKFYMKNGRYTFTGLEYGTPYCGRLTYYDEKAGWKVVDLYVTTVGYNKTGRNIKVDLADSYLKGSITPENLTRWIKHLDAAYDAYYDLVGTKPVNGSKITIKASSDNYGWAWVYSSNSDPTIYWKKDYISDELKVINKTDTWSFGILHELGHLFDINDRWNFDAEFWANTKMVYVLETLNAKVLMNNKLYTGAEIAQYYYSGAGSGSYINTLGKSEPTYSGDGLTYMFIHLKNQVGWNAFKSAFRYISDKRIVAPQNYKFNMFMSILKNNSNGYDPMSIFTANQKSVISSALNQNNIK